MFADPFTAVMALVVLHFVGMLLLFLFIVRSLNATQRAVSEANANLQLRMADMEHQLNDLSAALREAAAGPLSSAPDGTEKGSVELGELLEKGLHRLHAHTGTSLAGGGRADTLVRNISDSGKKAAGTLDILL